MKNMVRGLIAGVAVVVPLLFSANVWGADRIFSGKVALVEVRAAWGNLFVMSIVDSAGVAIKLCDSNTYPYAMGLPFSDASAKTVMAVALSAKVNDLTVVGWGLDASSTGGLACGIGNLALD